ncbi:AAA family ATPase [Mesorhizobium sp. M0976]|uniref:AAA family ATPase n=1 Tax=Mesorhizobium sp. M0976 TaxID=2957038 RepID=UPI003338673A
MKLEYVEVEGFRGFRRQTRFDVPSGFMVVAGRNGVGKSTILDAIDFALTGNINKYDVEKAKGGGLHEHLWWVGEGSASNHYVTVGFVDDEGQRHAVTRTRYRTEAEGLAKVLELLQDKTTAVAGTADGQSLMETTLIRDEVISSSSLDLPGEQRFNTVKTAIGSITGPNYGDRTGSILAEAKTALSEEQGRAQSQQTDLGRLLAQLTEARTEAAQSSDVAEAIRLISEAVPNNPLGTTGEAVRAMVADRRAALTRFQAAFSRTAQIQRQRMRVRSEEFSREVAEANAGVQRENELLAAWQQAVQTAHRLIQSEQDANVQGTHFAGLLQHGASLGLQAGHCPLCDAVRSNAEFAIALDQIRTKLAGQAERLEEAQKQVSTAERELEVSRAKVNEFSIEADGLAAEQAIVDGEDQVIRREYDLAGFGDVEVDDLEGAEKRAAIEQQRIVALERAALILGASVAMERVSGLEAQIARVRDLIEQNMRTIASLEHAVETARQIDTAAKSLSNEILIEQFETVMPLLRELYRRLRPHTDWTEIDTDFGGKVRASLNFSVGDGRNPQFLFSSGQRRAAGLAFLLAVHLSRPWCRWQTLLLDDPVQHVDDYRALNLVEVLAAIRRSGRQIVVAVQDAALADLLCRRLRSSVVEPGRRYDLGHATDGSARISSVLDILPLPEETLPLQVAS